MKNLRNKILATILTGTIAVTGVISTTTVYASEPAPTENLDVTENIDTGDNTSTIEDISNIEDIVIAAPIEDVLEENAVTDIVTTTTDTYDTESTTSEINMLEPATIDSTDADIATYSTKDSYIVVLDPGHGKPGTGTYRDYGDFVIDEAVINLKISQYTKAALEENYDNITVYMTKTTQNENPSLADRVEFAVSQNADLFVSQHVNSTSAEQTTANGVMAMVPTVDDTHTYNQDAAILSQKLAHKILDKLVNLGFKDNEFLYKLSGDNTQYPDGSLADYYGIVRHCRLNNLPGTIIEHGFANNESDALKLKEEEMLQKIGEADARGIVEYLIENEGYVPDEGNDPGQEPPVDYPFADVDTSKYYADPIVWAYENNITTGTTETTFEPEANCTRGQVVTFLHRTLGTPAPTLLNNPFTDIGTAESSDTYYYNAVLWAYENNITTGTTETTFEPDKTVTRAEFVTFLWRAAGSPTPTTTDNPFTDLDIDEYYYDAVLWAVENGITTGATETTFEPNEHCTRGQVVTFLYRTYAEENND